MCEARASTARTCIRFSSSQGCQIKLPAMVKSRNLRGWFPMHSWYEECPKNAKRDLAVEIAYKLLGDIHMQRATCEFAYTNKSTLVNSSLVMTLPSFTARLFISPIRSFFCPRNRIGSTEKKTHLTLGPDKGGQQT